MALGYTADQFYGVTGPTIGPGGTSALNPDTNSNPAFMFPGSTRKEFDPSTGKLADKTVKRGFIRLLSDMPGMGFSELARKRCFFQFNPQTIMRAVSMSEGMYNPILQDPSQFSLPIPGNANFSFELLFDRSFEVNSQVATTPPPPATTTPTGTPLPPPTDESFLNRLMGGSPADIGVLADIRVLDAIVGQGISEELIEYIKARGEIVQSYLSDTSTTSGSAGETTTTSSVDTSNGSFVWDSKTADTNLRGNLGNQAFLIPNPVRVVFSSLFMIDGYIQGMSVSFNKFSRTMVPTQCIVTIQMQALYFGFAREKTFLTESLAQAVVKPIEPSSGGTPANVEVPKEDVNGNKTQDLMIKYFNRFYVHVAGTDPDAVGVDYVDEPYTFNDNETPSDQTRELHDILQFNSPKVGVVIGFPNIAVKDGEDDVLWRGENSIGNLIKSVKITLEVTVTRGPFGQVEQEEYKNNKSDFMAKRGNLLKVNVDFSASSSREWKSNQQMNDVNCNTWTKYVNGENGWPNQWHFSTKQVSPKAKGDANELYFASTTDNARKIHPCEMKVTGNITVEYAGGKNPLVASINQRKTIYGWGTGSKSPKSLIRGTFPVNFVDPRTIVGKV